MSGAVYLFKQSDFHLLDILVLDTFIVVPILNANGRNVAHSEFFLQAGNTQHPRAFIVGVVDIFRNKLGAL